jgi:hypothetical protein
MVFRSSNTVLTAYTILILFVYRFELKAHWNGLQKPLEAGWFGWKRSRALPNPFQPRSNALPTQNSIRTGHEYHRMQ